MDEKDVELMNKKLFLKIQVSTFSCSALRDFHTCRRLSPIGGRVRDKLLDWYRISEGVMMLGKGWKDDK